MKNDPVFVLPIDVARLIRKVFLPRNPRKMRGAHPDTLAAVNHYIDALEALERRLTPSAEGNG